MMLPLFTFLGRDIDFSDPLNVIMAILAIICVISGTTWLILQYGGRR